MTKECLSVYEINKLTDNTLSKYKITKAIEAGDLKAKRINGFKNGSRNPKYGILKEDLIDYVKQSQLKNKSIILNKLTSIQETEKSENNVATLMNRISVLEKVQAELVNEISQLTDNKDKVNNIIKKIEENKLA